MNGREDRPAGRPVRGALAAAALVLGAGALLAGDGGVDPGVAPLVLAQRIRDREPGLRILDVRGAEYEPGTAVPTALPVDPGAPGAWPLDSATSVVVYGLDDGASRIARDGARAAGRADARHLSGGLAGWVTEVLEPVLPVPVTAADSAANARVGELSRYFGGLPRVGVAADTGAAAATVQRAARRGCGPR